MKNLLNYILLIAILISCSKDGDSLVDPDALTDHEIIAHQNNRVSSLLMSKSEYRNWVDNDEFTNSEKRTALTNDIYKKYADKYDFIFFILNEPNIPENLSYYGKLIGVSNNVEGTWLSVNLLFGIVPMMFFLPYFNRVFFEMTGRIYLGPVITCLIFIMILSTNTVIYFPI